MARMAKVSRQHPLRTCKRSAAGARRMAPGALQWLWARAVAARLPTAPPQVLFEAAPVLAPKVPAAPDAGRAPAAAAGDAAGGTPAWPFAHLSVDALEAALAKAMESDEMRARLTFAALDTEGSGELSHASLRLLLFHW